MKSTLSTSLIACILFGFQLSSSAAPAKKTEKIVRVCTLNSIKANQEFNRNVSLMKLQRQNIINLKAELDKTTDKAKKKELQKKIDVALAKLNENNKKMYKTYGFTLQRNYILVPEKTHIYMVVSDAEAKKIEAALKKKEKK